jgi:hypothetical protein
VGGPAADVKAYLNLLGMDITLLEPEKRLPKTLNDHKFSWYLVLSLTKDDGKRLQEWNGGAPFKITEKINDENDPRLTEWCHAMLICWYEPERRAFATINSWGPAVHTNGILLIDEKVLQNGSQCKVYQISNLNDNEVVAAHKHAVTCARKWTSESHNGTRCQCTTGPHSHVNNAVSCFEKKSPGFFYGMFGYQNTYSMNVFVCGKMVTSDTQFSEKEHTEIVTTKRFANDAVTWKCFAHFHHRISKVRPPGSRHTLADWKLLSEFGSGDWLASGWLKWHPTPDFDKVLKYVEGTHRPIGVEAKTGWRNWQLIVWVDSEEKQLGMVDPSRFNSSEDPMEKLTFQVFEEKFSRKRCFLALDEIAMIDLITKQHQQTPGLDLVTAFKMAAKAEKTMYLQ